MSNIEKIRQEIERLYDGEAPKHDQQCEFEDGYFTGIATISKFIDSLPDEDLYAEVGDTEEDYIKRSMAKVNECRKMICKDSLQGPETCKENTDSFTSLEEAAEKCAGEEMKTEDAMKELDEKIKKVSEAGTWDGIDVDRYLNEIRGGLTWDDIAKIDAIILDVNNEFAVDHSKEINRQKFYEEVLKRFKEAKK